MMLDQMFMIVPSLSSFLIVVTPTAVIPIDVAPIAVIFIWIYLNLPKFT